MLQPLIYSSEAVSVTKQLAISFMLEQRASGHDSSCNGISKEDAAMRCRRLTLARLSPRYVSCRSASAIAAVLTGHACRMSILGACDASMVNLGSYKSEPWCVVCARYL